MAVHREWPPGRVVVTLVRDFGPRAPMIVTGADAYKIAAQCGWRSGCPYTLEVAGEERWYAAGDLPPGVELPVLPKPGFNAKGERKRSKE